MPIFRMWSSFVADRQTRGVRSQNEGIAKAEEGVASELFPAPHTFQQVARIQGRQLKVRRDRRIEIGCYVEGCLHAISIKKARLHNCGDGLGRIL